MYPVSWRKVKSWNCVGCGMCCKDYHVVLNFNEWMSIVKTYGAEATIPTPTKLLLGKKSNGTCCFLNDFNGTPRCGLQYAKPLACKIWPFKVFNEPKFGDEKQALYPYRNRNFYVYVDPECTGLTFGTPSPDFKYKVLPEFIDVAAGLRNQQLYSTSSVNAQPPRRPFRGRTVI